jgi:hypothetical protein
METQDSHTALELKIQQLQTHPTNTNANKGQPPDPLQSKMINSCPQLSSNTDLLELGTLQI